MKIIQVTDLHLVTPGDQLHGLDPFRTLEACLADIRANHSDAEFCIITGDLAHNGEPAAYRALHSILETLPIPYHLLLGNHDRRVTYGEVFNRMPRDEGGFFQSVIHHKHGDFILLDTLSEGENAGAYCASRCAWLSAQLRVARGKPIYLFMHHPPFEIGIPSVDRIALKEPETFGRLLEGHRIEHLFFGHVHRPACGNWRGISWSTMRGLNHQVPFDLKTVSPVPKSHEPPAYAVIFIEERQVTVHFHDFLDKRTLVKRGESFEYA
ncbi:MAG: phosphodiesterase [Proteobacteria bacterium]|nr:phosphodiesterase [Pseudomonadota bacterium]